MSISQGIFPETLKIARIIPIFQGEMSKSYTIIDQYQCYPFLSNFLKQIIAAHVTEFLEYNDVLINANMDSEIIIPLATLL